MKAKEWAVSQGLAKAGKGRMSREAHDAVQKAIAGGMVFDDYIIGDFKARGKAKAAPIVKHAPIVKVKTPKRAAEMDEAPELRDAFMRYRMDQQFCYDLDGKTHQITGRSVCMNCGYSLVGHTCNDPLVLTPHGQQKVRAV